MPGLEERNIQLGSGFQTVEGRGVAVVVLPEATQGEFISEERFTFQARLCDSAEDLQKQFSAAMSVSAGAYAADLGMSASVNKATDSSRFGAYYMMELEFRKARRVLDVGTDILSPAIRHELTNLDSLEKWEEFYRTNGDHVVSSVTYGRKLIIIVSLSHKVQSLQLRRMLDARAGFSMPATAEGAVELHIESSLKALAEENISSVQIHSIGDSDPNFLREIDKLATLKAKIRNFVNADTPQPPTAAAEDTTTQRKSTQKPVTEKDRGVIISYSTCSYMDFLDKTLANAREIELAYDMMLTHTNRASRYLEVIALCLNRIAILNRNIAFFLKRHDGAFILDAATEGAAGKLSTLLKNHAVLLRAIAQELIAEVSGLSEDGRAHRSSIVKAKEILKLLEGLDEYVQEFDKTGLKRVLIHRLQLISQFEEVISAKGAALNLKDRFESLLLVLEKRDTAITSVVSSVEELRADVERATMLSLVENELLVRHITEYYHNVTQSPGRKPKKGGVLNSEIHQLFDELKQSMGRCRVQTKWLQNLKILCAGYDALVEKQRRAADSVEQADIQALLQRLGTLLMPVQRSRHLMLSGHQYTEMEILETINHMSDMLHSHIPEQQVSTIFERISRLKEQSTLALRSHDTSFLKAYAACRLNPNDEVLLKKMCRDHIQEVMDRATLEPWWRRCWEQVFKISQDLDSIVNNKMPLSAPLEAAKIFAAIDFKHEAYLVGIFSAYRGRWFDKEHFNGNNFQRMKLPTTTRCLRFMVEGEYLPAGPAVFDVFSRSKKQFDDHQRPHHKLYRQVPSDEPVAPLRLSMQELAALIGSREPSTLTRGEALMHDRNEVSLFRSVALRKAHFPGEELDPRCQLLWVRVFAQMNRGLECLGLSDQAPKGRADYGARFRNVDSSGGATSSDRQQPYRFLSTLNRDQTRAFQSTQAAAAAPRPTMFNSGSSLIEEEDEQQAAGQSAAAGNK